MVPNGLSVKSSWHDDAEDVCPPDLASRGAAVKTNWNQIASSYLSNRLVYKVRGKYALYPKRNCDVGDCRGH